MRIKEYTTSRPKCKPTPASPRKNIRRNLQSSITDPTECDQDITETLNASPVLIRSRACLDLNEIIDQPTEENGIDRCDAFVQSKTDQSSHTAQYSVLRVVNEGGIPLDAPNLVAYRQNHRDSFAKKLTELPNAGGGLHAAIYYAALTGLAENMSRDDIFEALCEAAEGHGRESGELRSEVWGAIQSAIHYLSGSAVPAGSYPCVIKKELDYEMIKKIVLENPKVSDLVSVSKPVPSSIADLLDCLFPDNPLLCCGWAKRKFRTSLLEVWQNDWSGLQFIVPSPMSNKIGKTVAGHMSQKSNDNTGPRTFQVIEFDFKPDAKPECEAFVRDLAEQGYSVMDINAALHFHLQGVLPLCMAVSSGNASIHGWYRCVGVPEPDIVRFQSYAHSLGADSALFVPSQFTRFPGGMRDNGNVQEVLYWNPEVLS